MPGPIDLVNVFRRPSDIPAHLDDILAARPNAVWMQSGIRHDAVAERLARAGIDGRAGPLSDGRAAGRQN